MTQGRTRGTRGMALVRTCDSRHMAAVRIWRGVVSQSVHIGTLLAAGAMWLCASACCALSEVDHARVWGFCAYAERQHMVCGECWLDSKLIAVTLQNMPWW